MFAIYKRELRSYFCSMIGYVYCAATILFIGLFFISTNVAQGIPMFAYALLSMMTIMLFTTPILTMRSFAEERKSKTDQMLLTYPVSTIKMVMGKYLAMMTVVALPFLISCACPLIIAAYGNGYPAVDYSTIFSMICLNAVFVSVGMFISSLTENQVIAAVLTFAALLLLCMWDDLVQLIPASASASLLGFIIILAALVLILYMLTRSRLIAGVVGAAGLVALLITYFVKMSLLQNLLPTVLGYFSCTQPMYSFAYNNVFDLGGIFLYLSMAALFIFLTVQSIQKRRWS